MQAARQPTPRRADRVDAETQLQPNVQTIEALPTSHRNPLPTVLRVTPPIRDARDTCSFDIWKYLRNSNSDVAFIMAKRWHMIQISSVLFNEAVRKSAKPGCIEPA
jgi:hypothetical protein